MSLKITIEQVQQILDLTQIAPDDLAGVLGFSDMDTLTEAALCTDESTVKMVVAFGSSLTRAIDSNESIYDSDGSIDGEIVEINFANEEAKTAYIRGLEHADGWGAYMVVAQGDQHPYIKKSKDDQNLTYEEWYEQDRQNAADIEAFEAYGDEINLIIQTSKSQQSGNLGSQKAIDTIDATISASKGSPYVPGIEAHSMVAAIIETISEQAAAHDKIQITQSIAQHVKAFETSQSTSTV